MQNSISILFVDDDVALRSLVSELLSNNGYSVETASDGESALRKIQTTPFDIVLTDLVMPKMNGMELLAKVKTCYPHIIVIIITGFGSISLTVEAMKKGASGFITKPYHPKVILHELQKFKRIVRRKQLKTGSNKQLNLFRPKDFIFEDAKMKHLDEEINTIATSDASVLIIGESGTGKEITAHSIHRRSDRKNSPFIRVSCAALADTVLESELFGHEKGAFTGAITERKGRFELAHEGTLFLDEIGDMPIATQVKLLRVLQEREFERVGGTKTIKVDIRIIAATNKNIKKEITKGLFRQDLFFRLSVIPLHIAPLRERKMDIPRLANYFLEKFYLNLSKEKIILTEKAIEKFIQYPWPGNVRELQNVMERLVVLSSGNIIDVESLPDEIAQKGTRVNLLFNLPYKEAKKQMLSAYLIHVLEKNRWNVSKTARNIGLNRLSLIRNMNKLKIRENYLEGVPADPFAPHNSAD